ncbi:MAG: tetratricopeptide repeat protein, partial [Dehalococcoidia bacterium]|nr:tetratricopeptide repeat protein [Dehalococcoidia bacterium]
TDLKGLALLISRSLVTREGERLSIHQALSDAARARMPAEAEARHRGYYLSLVNQDRGDWRRIGGSYGQIKQAWMSVPDDETLLELVWALRVFQERRGLWSDFLVWASRALGLAEAKGWRRDTGALLNNIGWVYKALGQRETALEYYGRALPIREEVGDRPGLAATLNNLGMVYDALAQREKALEYYRQALPIMEEVGDRYGESVTRYNLAMLYRDLGRLPEAVAELKKVVELDKLVQHPDLEADRAMLDQVEQELAQKGDSPQ